MSSVNATVASTFDHTATTYVYLYTLLLLCAIAYVTHSIFQYRRLSHIPGPYWASFTKLWMVRESLLGRQPNTFKDVNDRYGALARVGPNELITNDPEIMRRMMAVRSDYTRGHWYNAVKFDPARDNLFSMRDEVAHKELRAKMAAGYSGKENPSTESSINTQIAALITLISTKYLSTATHYAPLDFGEKASFLTLDVISDLAFGKAFGYLPTDTDVYSYLRITATYIPIMMVIANIPVLAQILQSKLMRRLLPSESDKLGFGAFIGVAKRVVAARFSPDAQPQNDMLGSFMRHGLTQDEASGEALLQVVAGSDTSAGTLRAVMLNILTNPRIYAKLRAEIDKGIEQGRISSPISDVEARKLPYLQAVIREGLRIMPPASGAFFKQVPEGGDVIDGKFVPAGTQIGSSPLGIHRSKRIFGVDADLFRPERWIGCGEERFGEMAATVDLVFHYGKYQCLGKAVALMEFNKVFVELLRRFDFAVVCPERPAKISNAGIWIMEDFWLRVEEREM
ncbi:cytochrome P450 [Plenodomus tracheiphilus IPT5]|uniref:Cytochrome P450 monooxygenase ABA1 n=1 Tax=Plenodomus tracheiphilus IPT5 TaxID=1408161 RepID=A0A6A7B767_9PLEO|nr:cytochrome P450 [Plenodomus tracheiphilus IPT5]